MPEILIATDAVSVHDEVRSVLDGGDTRVRWVRSGPAVRDSLNARPADLAVVDMQIGTMGGIAVALDLALEIDAGRLDPCPVVLLLDRRADVFLARRAGVAGWLLKPLDPIRIRRAAAAVIAGQTWHDTTYMPDPIAVPFASDTVSDAGK